MSDISVIICTRNRADSLRRTLEAFGRIRIPDGWEVELVVVDNGSTDNTQAVVKSTHFNGVKLRYFFEPKPGQSNARNTGLSVGQGEIIIFTDDDVVPAADWLGRLATPLLEKRYDAVVGRIEMAEHLRRTWMTPLHKIWLAAPDMTCGWELELIGANMGFHRSVLERVPAFDPELGPGALGFGDDSLFSWQLVEAGYRLHEVPEALIVHYFEPSRLLRSQWLDACRRRGHTKAYLLHHWHHGELKNPTLRAYYLAAKLHLRRILQPPVPTDAEGYAHWEMSYMHQIEICRQFLKERIRPRNYVKRGLVRLDVVAT
jgi:glucosyl-dolichyl phosphate glucuronosyltransferase